MTIDLLRRFPQLRSRPQSADVLPPAVAASHPVLADDLAVLAAVVAPRFARHDVEALRLQNAHRRTSVILLLGAALLAGLGGLGAAYADQAWPGAVMGCLAALVAVVSQAGSERGSTGRYLAVRLQAERLRALHFLFLARVAPFDAADVGERRDVLERAVLEIERGVDPA